jgi:hypothetical protein
VLGQLVGGAKQLVLPHHPRHEPDLHELAGDALARAWSDWARIGAMDNPAGYLYRVAQSAAR